MKKSLFTIAYLLAMNTSFADGVAIGSGVQSNESKVADDLKQTGTASGSEQQANSKDVKAAILERKENTHDSTSISDQAPPSIQRPRILVVQ